MNRFVLAASAAVASLFLLSAPAHAENGSEAINRCNGTPYCGVVNDSRGIVISYYNDDNTMTTIYCADASSECVTVALRGPRPSLTNQTAMSTVVGVNMGQQRPTRPTRPLIGRPFLARR